MSELPEGWTRAQLHQLMYSIEAGLNVKCDERPPLPGEPGLVKISAVTWGKFDELQSKTLPSTFEPDERNRIRSGDLLISRANTIELVGACVIVGPVERRLYLSDKVLRLLVHEPSKRWLNYVLKTPVLRKAIEKASTGNQLSMRNISQEKLRALEIPLAPEPEQQRIANQLDTLLTRIQSCNDRFDAIPALLKRFRQAVLDAASTGTLTEGWREEHCLEEAAALNELIELERSKRGALKVRGSSANVDSELLFEIPRSWAWVANHRLARDDGNAICAGPFGTIFKAKDFRSSGVPIIFLRHVGNSKFLKHKPGFMDKEVWAEFHQPYSVFGGELLVTKLGDPPGTACIYPAENGTAMVTPDVMKMSVDEEAAETKYLMYFFNSPNAKKIVEALCFGVTRLRIDLSMFKTFPIPLPPRKEQAEIVRRVEALFALADRIEARATAARTHAQRLSPLVLAKAFRGELGQQNPQDEPASVLLERLAATQPAKAKASRGRPRTKTQELFATPEGVQPDAAGLPDGMWAAPEAVDEHAVAAMLVAVLKAWGGPMPQMQARLAAVLCLQPRQMTAMLPAQQAAQWQRLVGTAADPLPVQVARLQPATDSAWRKAMAGMRARGDLVEEGSGPQATWALGPGAGQIETAGWPQGRAGWVVAYLRAQGAEAILPLLEPLTVEFVHARAA